MLTENELKNFKRLSGSFGLIKEDFPEQSMESPDMEDSENTPEGSQEMGNTDGIGSDDIRKVMYFCSNYNHDFITQIWGTDNIANHLKSKFDNAYNQVGASGVIPRFYRELDGTNQKKFENYVINNYKG